MSFFNIKKNKPEDTNYDGVYDSDYYSGSDNSYPDESAFASEEKDDLNIEDTPKRPTASYSPSMSSGSAFAMKLIKPTSYKEAPTIADFLINRCAVVLNLESANKETASNLIYFLTGVSYALGGQIKRVAANTYMLAPENMEISEEGRRVDTDSTDADDGFPG